MHNELTAMDRPEQAPGAADAEQVQKLASLGYLGAGRAPAASGRFPTRGTTSERFASSRTR